MDRIKVFRKFRNASSANMTSPITDFYRGKSIFITGATGFIGKVLVEKLLYSFPDLNHVYILIRSKRGNSPKERINTMWNLPVFNRLKQVQPSAINKLIGVKGDVLLENLGLSSSDIQILQNEVQVVFHCAATVRMDVKLMDAIKMNLCGTRIMLDICKNMSQLKVLVHLSTAFCYPDMEVLEEMVHDGTESPHDLMRAIQWLDDKSLDLITPYLLRSHPNTYTYSKRLAECLVKEQYPDLPIVVARPSIVSPAHNEPLEGWVDNLNGPVGIMVGGGKGVIRSMHCIGEYTAEFIPVDFAINGLIVLASKIGTMEQLPAEIPVCNLTSSDAKKTSWIEVLNNGKSVTREYPFDYPLWYPNGYIRSNKLVHDMCVLFYHLIPAYFIDFLMLLMCRKRFMVRIQNRISNGLEVLQFFTMRKWQFVADGYKDLSKSLTSEDKKKFPMDISVIDDYDYIKKCILGGRQYCMKEPLSTLPRARFVNKILYVISWIFDVLFYILIFYFLYRIFPRGILTNYIS